MSSKRGFKVFIFAFLLVSLLVALEQPLAQAAPASITPGVCEPDPDLVGCWQMDKGSGSSATDGGAEPANDATINTPLWVSGHGSSGYALSMNGSSGYARVNDESSLKITGAITLAAWIKPAQVLNRPIISKAVPSLPDGNGYELSISGTDDLAGGPGKVFFRINGGTKGNTYRVNSTTDYNDNLNSWIHVAGVYNGSTMKLYYNGSEQGTLTTSVTVGTSTWPLGIGAQGDDSTSRHFNGTIDDVRVYKRALSANEIKALAGIPTAINLASFYGSSLGSTVHLTWTTASEEDLVGFNLYRSESANGEAQLVNPSLIPAQNIGQLTGASYQFTDIVNLGQHYFYRLELVKQDGNWPGPQVGVKTGFWVHMPLLVH